nr:hypothetical protein [Tanacetum cinerariifolium]
MPNLSEDIQCAGSDTRPPLLDRTDFASWQQRIRLFCRGKDNRVNILKSTDEGSYKMGTYRETLAESTEGTPQFRPERPRIYSDLKSEEKDRTDFASWQQRIRLFCRGKDNRVNILKSTDEGSYKMGTYRETLAESTEGTPQFRPERPRIYSDLKSEEKDRSHSCMMSLNTSDNKRDSQFKTIMSDSSSPAEELIKNLTNTLALLTQSYRTFLPQTNNQLRTSSNARNQAIIQDGRVVVQNVQRRPNRGQGINLRGGNTARYEGAPNRVRNDNQGQARPGQARTVKCYNCNDTGHIAQNYTQPKRPQNSKYFKDKMLLMQAQENRVALDAEQLLFLAGGQDNVFNDDVDDQLVQGLALNVDNVFQADDCDAFDSNVDKAPTAQTMFMANLSSADPVIDEAEPSYDSDILFEVPDYKHYLDAACAHHEGHMTHDNIQLDHFVDSHADYTSDSHMNLYDQYVRDNKVPVVLSGASSVPTDAFMMIYDDMCEPHDQLVSYPSRNTVVKNSLTAELAIYKEHVELYKQRAKFELTEREQKINEQLRIVISDRNFKEETLKKELHSIKLQLASTINHNKSMVEEVSFLKKDFKQKENKYLADFWNIKTLKEKLALYNGHKDYTSAIVHNSEDTLEIAEITRKKMNDKMNDPECVTCKVKISPHDYSKENLLATFTPKNKQTPEQIFWSNDLMKLKSEALKERTKVSRPLKAFTVPIKAFIVYPPNTPATLVPKVLPTKSQVKIQIFTLIQMFLEFDKTCKKRITPTGLTDGERRFEQTKACYLKEVIPFFKTIKDNFEGIQKALTKEVKEMKYVFEELEAEVAQCAVDRKHDAIDRKNLLIANDNLIAECLSKEVFSVVTKSELNVARFAKIHVANTSVEARCLALEAELATLRDKSHQENQRELIKHFSKLEVDHLNLQLKYQNLKDSIRNNPPTPGKDTPNFDSVFVIGKMQASLQGKVNAIRQLKKQLSKLQVTSSDSERTVKVRTTNSQLTKVTNPITNLQAQNDIFRAENDKVKQHYKQLYDSIKITRAKHIEQMTKLTAKNVTLKTSVSKAKVQPPVLTRTKHAVDVEPIVPRLRNNRDAHLDYLRHLKESVKTIRDIVEEANVVRLLDRSIVFACRYTKHSQELLEISPAKGANKLPVEDLPRTNKSYLRTTNRVDSSSRLKRTEPKQVGKVWKPTGKVLTTIGHQWRPTGWILHLGKQCPLTRFTPPQVVSVTQNKKQARTCANQVEPNHNWGSKVSIVPSLSGFKCRSYRSSFGIWIPAAQNI